MIEKLSWDSSFFGYNVGKVDLFNSVDFQEEKFVSEAQDYSLVYLFSKEKLYADVLDLVDEKIILFRETQQFTVTQNKFDFCLESFSAKVHDIDDLRELGLQSGIYSRFNIDPNFKNNEYQKLYLKWVEESIAGNLAFDIIVAISNSKLIGFITLKEKSKTLSEIGLIATDVAYRGKGVGIRLIQEAISRSFQQGYNIIQVATQSSNIPALALYNKGGFRFQKKIIIYHYWNK
jgi:dTDP-4-amino-4,6-dideoxy-D-galactose acyltransferase